MAVVVNIGDYKKRDFTGVLRELLVKSSRGQVAGIAFNVEFSDGTQKAAFLGRYRDDRREAVRVANRLSKLLNAVADSDSGGERKLSNE